MFRENVSLLTAALGERDKQIDNLQEKLSQASL